MTAILLKLIWKVDDADGFEGAFFDANPAATAKGLCDDGFASFDAYGFYFATYHRAEANAE